VKYAVTPETNPKNIPPKTDSIHLVRPVKEKTLRQIIRKCKSLKSMSLSVSCAKRLSGKVKELLKKKGIELKIENNRGRAIELPLQKMLDVIEMAKDGRPLREIEATTSVPKSTVHYLVKYAERGKVKQGKETIYLK